MFNNVRLFGEGVQPTLRIVGGTPTSEKFEESQSSIHKAIEFELLKKQKESSR